MENLNCISSNPWKMLLQGVPEDLFYLILRLDL